MDTAREESTISSAPDHSDLGDFRSQLGPLLILMGVFFLNFICRIVMAPLMPEVEHSLGLSHAQAGSLFLPLTLGYFLTCMGSGFVSSRLGHRKTIIFSALATGAALGALSQTGGIGWLRSGMLFLGLGAGLYLPSGLATLTSLVNPAHWGKAMAVHELAPNLSFFLAPLVAIGLLEMFSWRGAVGVMGTASLGWGLCFARWGRGGDFAGQAPNLTNLRVLTSLPAFWIMILFFSMGVGGSLGIYNILPLYLVNERGMSQDWANLLVAFSRITGMGASFLSGWATDRLGPRKALAAIFSVSGVLIVGLGVAHGNWLVLFLFLQLMAAVCFFPAGFSALARIGPESVRSVTISFAVPPAFVLGGGVLPAGIGYLGEMHSFGWGIGLTGVLFFLMLLLLPWLRLTPGPDRP